MINTLNDTKIDLNLNKINVSKCEADIGPVIRIIG